MKKSRIKNSYFKSGLSFFIIAVIFIVASCDFDDVSGPEPDPNPDPDPPPADTAGAVAPDGVLEAVTWNIEWYGSTGNGPSDEDQQTGNVIKVVDSLKADLYAFQEINDQEALNQITGLMKGYRGFTAEEQPRNQHTAFVFNTQTIDSVSSGLIEEGQDYRDWASGRYPFFFSFNYKVDKDRAPIKVYAVVIHAKASDDQESYQRRKRAAKDLHTYLTLNKPNANIVFLGDYNDDVDESIYESSQTPYQPFVEDEDDFLIVTKSLSEDKQSSTTGYPDTVDHITISNEMEAFYMPGSEMAFAGVEDFIDNYAGTTSDHYPIMAKFDMQE